MTRWRSLLIGPQVYISDTQFTYIERYIIGSCLCFYINGVKLYVFFCSKLFCHSALNYRRPSVSVHINHGILFQGCLVHHHMEVANYPLLMGI